MPRVKELTPADKRKAVIEYCIAYKGWDDARFEKELNISRCTRISRMKDVGKFSLEELQKIVHGVPLSPGQISTLLGGIEWDSSGLEMRLRGVI